MDEGTDEFGKFLKANYIANECESSEYYKGCTYPFERADNLIQVSPRVIFIHIMSSYLERSHVVNRSLRLIFSDQVTHEEISKLDRFPLQSNRK